MRFSSVPATVAVFSAFSLVHSFDSTTTYDNTYDNPKNSLDIVACSNGPNGLITKGFTTFGSLPDFPYIGGAPAVKGWNSPKCGSCWALTYKGKTINGEFFYFPRPLCLANYDVSSVLAIDVGSKGFNIAQKAMDKLTDNQSVQLGIVDITAKEVPASKCGLV